MFYTKLVPNFSHSTGKVRRVQKVGTFLFACVVFALAMGSTQHGVIYGGAPALEQGRNLNELIALGNLTSHKGHTH